MLARMVGTTIVLTAVLLGALGMRAERNRRLAEVWLCTAVAAVLLVLTAAAHASGQVG
jgi:hypothetical protein